MEQRSSRFAEIMDRFRRARVLVIGDLMLDRFVYGSVERISPEAPIPVLAVEREVNMPGGAANVARNISTLGGSVVLASVVGADTAAAELSALLEAYPGVELALSVDSARPTTTKVRFVAEGQQIVRADRETKAELNAQVTERLMEAIVSALAKADVVVLSDYAKGVLTVEVIRRTIDAARARGTPVVVDPKSRDFSRYSGATVLTPNRHELQVGSGIDCDTDDGVVEAARGVLAGAVCDVVVATRGSKGMSIVAGGATQPIHLRTTAREVFDVSGAGDTVVATLALGLAVGASVPEAAAVANVAAGVVVGKRGTAVVATSEILASLPEASASVETHKLFTLAAVLRLREDWAQQGLKVAFTNGCFDLLHPGHLSLLEQARRTADRLIVALNADSSVSRLKGAARPVQGELARAMVLASLRFVDAVVIFSEDTPLEMIRALYPDVLVKGADYSVEQVVGADVVLRRGGQVVLANLVPGHSTTRTVARLAAGGA